MALAPTLHYPTQSHYFILFYTELNYLLFPHIVYTNYSRFGRSMLFVHLSYSNWKVFKHMSKCESFASHEVTFMSPHLLPPLTLHCYNLPKPSAFNTQASFSCSSFLSNGFAHQSLWWHIKISCPWTFDKLYQCCIFPLLAHSEIQEFMEIHLMVLFSQVHAPKPF